MRRFIKSSFNLSFNIAVGKNTLINIEQPTCDVIGEESELVVSERVDRALNRLPKM